MKRTSWKGVAVVAVVAGWACVAGGQTILRVKSDAPAGGNGASWATAYDTLQAALAAATPGTEVWVAQGTYTNASDPVACFRMPTQVALFGGFRGDETLREQRAVDTITTILRGGATKSVAMFSHVDGLLLDGFQFDHGAGSGDLRRRSATEPFSTSFHPGGGALIDASVVDFVHCAFTGNIAWYGLGGSYPAEPGSGAGAAVRNSTVRFTNCSFADNHAYNANVAECGGGNPYMYTFPGDGGAIASLDSTLEISDCWFVANSAGNGLPGYICSAGSRDGEKGGLGGAIAAWGTTLTIERCVFHSNSAGRGGPGTQYFFRVTRCGAPGDGGAVWISQGQARISNSLFVQCVVPMSQPNSLCPGYGASGGAVCVGPDYITPVTVSNCTFYGNTAIGMVPYVDGVGGALAGHSFTLSNCIFWNNQDGTGNPISGQIGPTPLASVSHCIVQGLTSTGHGNSGLDPRFFDPLGPDGVLGTADDRFDLRPDSPAIDAGNNTLYTFGPLDLAGHARRIDVRGIPDTGVGPGAVIDMGAYEYVPCAADFDDGTGSGRPDGAVTVDDLLYWLACYEAGSLCADVNGDGAITIDELLLFLQAYEAGC